jgi:ABC-type multidrug transport system fused ATPase/permease subunit
VIRILIAKPKIVIIKDIPSFIGSTSLIEELFKKMNCTIIKISNKIESAVDVQRIIYVKDHRIIEDGNPHEIREKNETELGKLLHDANL